MNVKILISRQARERAKKDKYIKSNRIAYIKEVNRIQASYGNRPREVMGKFLVSPRGNKKIRVAWHFAYDKNLDTLVIYIDDLLYHITDEYYVDKWNEKVRIGLISLNSYSHYIPWAGL